ncbi:MAG TPA: single-stranded DNA-binding protein [Bacteroidia bacterium]|nr:single-stranded DNA-binding protein [Bacteroidia bacterium]HNT80834.1 single-stranded DNA-binding protein [Bacteroidia bacterium]
MNAMRNKVQLIGFLGQDPQVKEFDNGKKMVKFTLATNETYKNASGERVTETQWHNLVAWGKTAGIVERFLSKGKEVALEGKLVNRSYEDKNGVKKYISEVQVNDLLLLGKNS